MAHPSLSYKIHTRQREECLAAWMAVTLACDELVAYDAQYLPEVGTFGTHCSFLSIVTAVGFNRM